MAVLLELTRSAYELIKLSDNTPKRCEEDDLERISCSRRRYFYEDGGVDGVVQPQRIGVDWRNTDYSRAVALDNSGVRQMLTNAYVEAQKFPPRRQAGIL